MSYRQTEVAPCPAPIGFCRIRATIRPTECHPKYKATASCAKLQRPRAFSKVHFTFVYTLKMTGSSKVKPPTLSLCVHAHSQTQGCLGTELSDILAWLPCGRPCVPREELPPRYKSPPHSKPHAPMREGSCEKCSSARCQGGPRSNSESVIEQ